MLTPERSSPAASPLTMLGSRRAGVPARARRVAVDRPAAISFALIAIGVALFLVSIAPLPLGKMDDTGLASVLPVEVWVSMGLVTAGWAVAWWWQKDALVVFGLLATILVFHGPGVLGEPTMRFATTWQHVGISDYIAQHGSVDPNIDAYFNWPGFFILSAFLSEVAGWHNIEPLARIAPLFYNAMYLIPVVAIGRALFTDRRIVWLGAWLFFINNWIGQDYYSPQGFAVFMYLVLVAVVLTWFKGPVRVLPDRLTTAAGQLPGAGIVSSGYRRVTRDAVVVRDAASTHAQRVLLVIALLAVVISVVGSHQLTPFAMVSATAALSIVGWCRLRTLPLAILLITVLWVLYMASVFLLGHLHGLVGDVGAVDSTVNSSVGGRIYGSSGHTFIVQLRVFSTLLLWGLAMLGFARQALGGRLSVGLIALAASPFPLLALQSYGGEVLLRIGLFSLPFMAFGAASLFVPANGARIASRRSWRSGAWRP